MTAAASPTATGFPVLYAPVTVQFEDMAVLQIQPDQDHEWLLTTEQVAEGYGVSVKTIQGHKLSHADELVLDRHFLAPRNPRHGNLTITLWTRRGIIRLGFFIRSERAKKFRAFCEDLVIEKLTPVAPPAPPAPTPLPAPAKLAYVPEPLYPDPVFKLLAMPADAALDYLAAMPIWHFGPALTQDATSRIRLLAGKFRCAEADVVLALQLVFHVPQGTSRSVGWLNWINLMNFHPLMRYMDDALGDLPLRVPLNLPSPPTEPTPTPQPIINHYPR
jgi:hypothetical protein